MSSFKNLLVLVLFLSLTFFYIFLQELENFIVYLGSFASKGSKASIVRKSINPSFIELGNSLTLNYPSQSIILEKNWRTSAYRKSAVSSEDFSGFHLVLLDIPQVCVIFNS